MAAPRPSQTSANSVPLAYRPTYSSPHLYKNMVQVPNRPIPSPPQMYNTSIPSPYRPAQPQSLERNGTMQLNYRPSHLPPPPPPNHTYIRPQAPPSHTYYGPPPSNYHYAQTQLQFHPDNSYLLDSSLSTTNSVNNQSPKKSKFPPPTRENLVAFRKEAMQSEDPHLQLEYVKFLLEAAKQIQIDERDPQRANKLREGMLSEAQKIAKKLASHSGMGKQGYPEAQFFLANQYGTGGMGLSADAEKAFSLYIQGSKQNHPGCTFRVAVCYEVGAGTKRDKSHAIQFYRKAANLSEPVAMYKLGVIMLKGLLHQTKNPREGISWLKRAAQEADERHPQALHELGLAYEKEGVPSVIPDPSYAHELFTQAAQYGYAPSQFKLGQAYENGLLNCPIDPRRSIAWYSKAAEKGDVEAEFALSGWYLTGADGILPQNDNEAYLWARKAADKGYAKAEYAVGYYTETGTGTRQNLEEARRWYSRAATQNYTRAIQRLAELKRGNVRPQQRRRHTREDAKEKDADCIIM
ncbi:hypothetical protein BY458DRAFT_519120 [Sporodiniella umbellata]|nr:hypothetical protein BY458DRAFT_519120 [Sporodiniella umbellata]